MSRFLENAASILETAVAAQADGTSSGDIGILIDAGGMLRIVDAAGWQPDALHVHYGARTIYQVTRTPGGVQVSGRTAGQSCTLAQNKPDAVIRLLTGTPRYSVVSPLQLQ